MVVSISEKQISNRFYIGIIHKEMTDLT